MLRIRLFQRMLRWRWLYHTVGAPHSTCRPWWENARRSCLNLTPVLAMLNITDSAKQSGHSYSGINNACFQYLGWYHPSPQPNQQSHVHVLSTWLNFKKTYCHILRIRISDDMQYKIILLIPGMRRIKRPFFLWLMTSTLLFIVVFIGDHRHCSYFNHIIKSKSLTNDVFIPPSHSFIIV